MMIQGKQNIAQEGQRPVGRLRGVILGVILIWTVLVGRLVQVQGIDHAEYDARAWAQYERRIELTARRGQILDRSGRLMALDRSALSYYAHPAQVDQPRAVAAHFAAAGVDGQQALYGLLQSGKPFVYMGRRLGDEQQKYLAGKSFTGVFSEREITRLYPYGSLAGQLLGHTNIDHEGREGVELAYEDLLRQRHGSALSLVDGRGRSVPGQGQERETPQDGQNIVLTLDAVYQGILEEELQRAVDESGAERATGLITDPRTGDILALAHVPLYDPNKPGKVPAAWRLNRAVSSPFEPGSTFKLVTAAAVLEEGLISPSDSLFCENGLFRLEGGAPIRDTHPSGMLSMAQVMEESSNIGTAKMARLLERHRYYQYIRNFGFGTRSGIGLPAESAGQLSPSNKWSKRSQETIAMGQEISATALQMAMAYGAIANGGVLMAPRLVQAVTGDQGQIVEETQPQAVRRLVSPATAATLTEILTGVVDRGTGKMARIEGVAVAGKTGTAQQAAADGSGYDPKKLVVSFIGFLPAGAPELVCLIAVDYPKRKRWGGQLAAPTFKRVVERVLHLGNRPGTHPEPAERQQMAAGLPDLRGMTQAMAQFQAEIRGWNCEFSGRGEVVLGQEPAPGTDLDPVGRVVCLLGGDGDLRLPGPVQGSRRQVLWLRQMRGAHLAALD
ncbi:MAG: PASTA domain-containing protein [Candidatus Latescibacteria bacterium]|nr:PASTA domain-containing protein [Candidatus Latescibacterota bacterium]